LSGVVLDSHVLHWWSAEPDRLSAPAARAVAAADELIVADISWYELAWLARHERIIVSVPIGSWLAELAAQVRTIAVTPAIAAAAVALPGSFPSDPADRLIYATAIETGARLITKDRNLRAQTAPRPVTIW
jgi:PIN domain nuclease of toxin-antitoxin system